MFDTYDNEFLFKNSYKEKNEIEKSESQLKISLHFSDDKLLKKNFIFKCFCFMSIDYNM